MQAYEWQTIARAGSTIKIALFSDCHVDSPDCDVDKLVEDMKFCVKENRYMIFDGDTIDGILLGDRKRAAAHLITNTDNQLNVKLQQLYELFKPFQSHILFFGRGNHEESIIKYSGLDVLEMLTTMLNMGQEHKILYGNYANFLRFTFKEPGKNKREYHYDIFAHHGAGGAAPATKGMLDFGALTRSVNADLIWIGHKHNAIVDFSAPVMHIDRSGNVVFKNRQCIETPSYQKPRTMDNNNVHFSERFYGNTAMPGFGCVNLKCLTSKENGYQIVPEITILTNPRLTIGRVQGNELKLKGR